MGASTKDNSNSNNAVNAYNAGAYGGLLGSTGGLTNGLIQNNGTVMPYYNANDNMPNTNMASGRASYLDSASGQYGTNNVGFNAVNNPYQSYVFQPGATAIQGSGALPYNMLGGNAGLINGSNPSFSYASDGQQLEAEVPGTTGTGYQGTTGSRQPTIAEAQAGAPHYKDPDAPYYGGDWEGEGDGVSNIPFYNPATGQFDFTNSIFAPQYYPEQTIADRDIYTQAAIDRQAQRGLLGSVYNQQAGNQLMQTLGGAYMRSPVQDTANDIIYNRNTQPDFLTDFQGTIDPTQGNYNANAYTFDNPERAQLYQAPAAVQAQLAQAGTAQADTAQANTAQGQAAQADINAWTQDNNDYLDSMVDRAQKQSLSAVNSAFSQAGRYGSGAHEAAAFDAANNLANQMYGEQYNQDRNRSLQAWGDYNTAKLQNAGLLNTANLENAKMANDVGVNNMAQANNVALNNAQMANNVALNNAQMANTLGYQNAQMANNVNTQNALMGNENSQYNAGQMNNVGLNNAQYQNAAALQNAQTGANLANNAANRELQAWDAAQGNRINAYNTNMQAAINAQNTLQDAYQNERNNMMQAMQYAPSLAAEDYRDLQALSEAGIANEGYQQDIINSLIDRWNYEQQAPMNALANVGNFFNGAMGSSQSSTGGSSPGVANRLATGLSSGLGAGALATMAGLGGPWSLGIGAAGGLLGMLG